MSDANHTSHKLVRVIVPIDNFTVKTNSKGNTNLGIKEKFSYTEFGLPSNWDYKPIFEHVGRKRKAEKSITIVDKFLLKTVGLDESKRNGVREPKAFRCALYKNT